LWSWLTTSTYQEAVLKAINLGGDTDTIGAITGGLAALSYGMNEVPTTWLKQLIRVDDIVELGNKLYQKMIFKV